MRGAGPLVNVSCFYCIKYEHVGGMFGDIRSITIKRSLRIEFKGVNVKHRNVLIKSFCPEEEQPALWSRGSRTPNRRLRCQDAPCRL